MRFVPIAGFLLLVLGAPGARAEPPCGAAPSLVRQTGGISGGPRVRAEVAVPDGAELDRTMVRLEARLRDVGAEDLELGVAERRLRMIGRMGDAPRELLQPLLKPGGFAIRPVARDSMKGLAVDLKRRVDEREEVLWDEEEGHPEADERGVLASILPEPPSDAHAWSFLRDEGNVEALLLDEPVLDGDGLARCRVRPAPMNDDRRYVALALDDEASRRFVRVTRRAEGERVAVTMRRQVLAAPVVREPVDRGVLLLDPRASPELDAVKLAAVLRSGPLPEGLELAELERLEDDEAEDASDGEP